MPSEDAIFADLDGDGFLDLCLDRQRFYRCREKGNRFEVWEGGGIELPVVETVPLTKDGRPDRAKAKTGPYVPHDLEETRV